MYVQVCVNTALSQNMNMAMKMPLLRMSLTFFSPQGVFFNHIRSNYNVKSSLELTNVELQLLSFIQVAKKIK